MDAVDTAGAVLVDLVDGVFDAGLFEALFFAVFRLARVTGG